MSNRAKGEMNMQTKQRGRRFFAVLLTLAMLLSAVPLTGLTAFAAGITSGDFQYEVLSETDKTCEITYYTGSATTLDIPSELDGYTVTSIGDSYEHHDPGQRNKHRVCCVSRNGVLQQWS